MPTTTISWADVKVSNAHEIDKRILKEDETVWLSNSDSLLIALPKEESITNNYMSKKLNLTSLANVWSNSLHSCKHLHAQQEGFAMTIKLALRLQRLLVLRSTCRKPYEKGDWPQMVDQTSRTEKDRPWKSAEDAYAAWAAIVCTPLSVFASRLLTTDFLSLWNTWAKIWCFLHTGAGLLLLCTLNLERRLDWETKTLVSASLPPIILIPPHKFSLTRLFSQVRYLRLPIFREGQLQKED